MNKVKINQNKRRLLKIPLEMSNGVVFPPVIVFYDGTNYWLADGFHRVAAAVFCGWTAIAAIVKQGTCRDAVLFSCGVNATHGLRRTNEDKRRAVLRLLEDDEWSQWSDREIARRSGVGNKFVGDVRRSLCSQHSNQHTRTYKTKHDTVATMNISNIGKTPQRSQTPLPTSSDTPDPTTSKRTDSQSTSVVKELPQQEKPLGLTHNQRTDQVRPDVECNQTTPNDVGDRLTAQVDIAALDSDTRKAIIALKEQLLSLEDNQLENLGKVIGVKCSPQATTLASSLAIADPEIARAVINAIAVAYPFLASDRGNS
ncbi:MAG: ParB N-terminal domain-containing protein [Calothrix sp. MO_192.B10]|nr:ParB N-terminal domain-containing protein [Calothrix sp. MO_192.B10]